MMSALWLILAVAAGALLLLAAAGIYVWIDERITDAYIDGIETGYSYGVKQELIYPAASREAHPDLADDYWQAQVEFERAGEVG